MVPSLFVIAGTGRHTSLFPAAHLVTCNRPPAQTAPSRFETPESYRSGCRHVLGYSQDKPKRCSSRLALLLANCGMGVVRGRGVQVASAA